MSTITLIRLDLVMDEPGGVGRPGPLREGEPDILVDTDIHDRPHIPGSSLAGSLRARVAEYDHTLADKWFGLVQGDESTASAIWVLGSRRVAEDGSPLDTADSTANTRPRTTTAISRHRGAAETSMLRTTEELAPGTRLAAYLQWPGASPEEVQQFLSLVDGWAPLIGRATSTGHGRCHLERVAYGQLDLSSPADLQTWLTLSGPELIDAVTVDNKINNETPRTPGDRARYAVAFSTEGPLAFGLDEKGCLPDGGLPGASVKGVIRSRVEFILRSVGLVDMNECGPIGCGTCWACRLFGHSAKNAARSGSVGQRALVRITEASISGTKRERIHVALDRITGGAARQSRDDGVIHDAGEHGGMLHTMEGYEQATVTMAFDVDRLKGEDLEAFQHLLTLVLADINDGHVGFGRATTRGYGTLQLSSVTAPEGRALPDIEQARTWLNQQVEARKAAG